MALPEHPVLSAFLSSPSRTAGTLSYHETQGFLFAVASCPELVPPSAWIPEVFGDEGADYDTVDEANAVMRELMALYNAANEQVLDRACALPPDVEVKVPPLDNLVDDAPLSQWSRGFLEGHQWLGESWESVPTELEEELNACFMMLSFFASSDETREFFASGEHGELGTVADSVCQLLPDAMNGYARLGRALGQALLEFGQPAPARSQKIGRNDPCRCGSGRKFKRCCGAVN